MRVATANECQTLPELLCFRAELHPDRTAAIFVDDDGGQSQMTYRQLWQRTIAVARLLMQTSPGGRQFDAYEAPRAILVFPPGLDFLPAFLGAQLAGWIPVPTSYPKPHRAMPRVNSVVRDCAPSAILTNLRTLAGIDRRQLAPAAAALPVVVVDADPAGEADYDCPDPSAISPESIALLQYTSGSTSEPKGVIVSQRNLMANIAAISASFGMQIDHSTSPHASTAASWLPAFHDMGLIGGMLTPLFLGFRSVLISPQSFVQRPIRWLKLITDFQAIVSGGPNFAYELCADRIAPAQMESLNLASLQVAYCGAEPIRARTLHTFAQRFSSVGFRESSFYPCYGLAEATLIAAGGQGPGVPRVIHLDRTALRESRVELAVGRSKQHSTALVACGSATAGTTLKIVDPTSSNELSEGQIGEVWLQGDSITRGYWNRPEENASRFGILQTPEKTSRIARWFQRAAPSRSEVPARSQASYLRTGDLGMILDGQLYITGRIKDVVIIRGRNYAPQDIEQTVLDLQAPVYGRCAAVSVDGPRAEGVGMIVEVERGTAEQRFPEVVRSIRRAIIEEHELDPRLVLLVRPATIPVTTSGKIKRSACRAAIAERSLDVWHRWERSGGMEAPPLPIPVLPACPVESDRAEVESLVRNWLGQWLVSRVGIDPVEIQMDRAFDDYGLDSLTAVELSGELEDWSGVELTPTDAWEHPTIASMAQWLASGLIGTESAASSPAEHKSAVRI